LDGISRPATRSFSFKPCLDDFPPPHEFSLRLWCADFVYLDGVRALQKQKKEILL
jgi:hypothetical protein